MRKHLVPLLRAAAEGTWGIRWTEYIKGKREQKEKLFPTEKAMDNFLKKLEAKLTFSYLDMWLIPPSMKDVTERLIETRLPRGYSVEDVHVESNGTIELLLMAVSVYKMDEQEPYMTQAERANYLKQRAAEEKAISRILENIVPAGAHLFSTKLEGWVQKNYFMVTFKPVANADAVLAKIRPAEWSRRR